MGFMDKGNGEKDEGPAPEGDEVEIPKGLEQRKDVTAEDHPKHITGRDKGTWWWDR